MPSLGILDLQNLPLVLGDVLGSPFQGTQPDGPASCGPLEVGIPAATLKVVTNNLHGAAVKVFAATALIGHRCVVRGVEVEAWGAGFHGEGHERG